MSVVVNYYLGVKCAAPVNVNQVLAGTTTSGTAVDVEVRLQTDNGSANTSLTRKRSVEALKVIIAFIESGGNNHDGAALPPL